MTTSKICTTCEVEKVFTEFHVHKRGKFGFAAKCKKCVSITTKSYDRVEYGRRYYHENKVRRLPYHREYAKKNPSKFNAKNAKRRVRTKANTPELSKTEKFMIEGLYFISKALSRSCGEPFEVDHIQPISKGGGHTYNNLQILTRHENRTKGDKTLEP